ncbi:MAG: Uma2 family endonuclease [Acidobacteriota bacterium]|nr:Uma2 family endonuclease [Acidobacteriota bacterium]
MSTITISWLEVVKGLPADSLITLRHIPWEEYEELLAQLGEDRSGLRISYDERTLQAMTLSPEHEKYARFFETLMTAIRLRLRLNILSFGSSTMKKRSRSKGTEPDACFYIQTASVIGNRMQLNFATDPPPDIAVEIDIHHGSIDKFPICAALGVPEIWHYDGAQLRIHLLERDEYVSVLQSQALPILTSHILTDLLTRLREEGEFQTILGFDEWLQTQSGAGR